MKIDKSVLRCLKGTTSHGACLQKSDVLGLIGSLLMIEGLLEVMGFTLFGVLECW